MRHQPGPSWESQASAQRRAEPQQDTASGPATGQHQRLRFQHFTKKNCFYGVQGKMRGEIRWDREGSCSHLLFCTPLAQQQPLRPTPECLKGKTALSSKQAPMKPQTRLGALRISICSSTCAAAGRCRHKSGFLQWLLVLQFSAAVKSQMRTRSHFGLGLGLF